MRLVLVTNALSYAGPGAVEALSERGARLLCHDPAFADPLRREAFEQAHPGATALAANEPDGLCAEAIEIGLPDAIVSNDVHPIASRPIEDVPIEEFDSTYRAVVRFPVRLTQLFLPAMKGRGSGSFVFVTSARERRPEPGFATPTTLRAATTAFAKALAVEAAPFGIQANVVAPNYLYSETYYPKARFIDDPAGRALIARTVPFGRLGEPREIGELIAFLASGASPFTTGQVIAFTGGWG